MAPLPKLYAQGYAHAIADAVNTLDYQINKQRRIIRDGLAAEKRAAMAVVQVLEIQRNHISKMVTNQDERLERNEREGVV